jgi:hypothetical protein
MGKSELPGRKRRFIYNTDGNNMLIHSEPPMRPEDLESQIKEIADTSVTTLCISPNIGMKVSYPSSVAETFTDDPRALEGSHRTEALNLLSLMEAGHDPLALMIELGKARGLEVFVSFRLNEVHAVEQPDSPILSDFWKNHPEWRLGSPGDPVPDLQMDILGPRVHPIVASWLPAGLNFAIPEVRECRLAELRDLCERYPIDGLDLDFQRFPVYFPFGSETEYIEVMTDWVRDVRTMTEEVGRARGQPLLLSARVMARPEQNIALGLDPATWAKEGLVDFVIVSHYLRNDYTLPISEFRALLPPSMPIYASIEVEPTREAFLDVARPLWREDPDGIMVFNFFSWRERGEEPPFDILDVLGDSDRALES